MSSKQIKNSKKERNLFTNSRISVDHLKHCRCCLNAFKLNAMKIEISEEIYENFFILTQTQLECTEKLSNVICIGCFDKMELFKSFKTEMINVQDNLHRYLDNSKERKKQTLKEEEEEEMIEEIMEVDVKEEEVEGPLEGDYDYEMYEEDESEVTFSNNSSELCIDNQENGKLLEGQKVNKNEKSLVRNQSGICHYCGKNFRPYDLKRHMSRCNETKSTYFCDVCPKSCPNKYQIKRHIETHVPMQKRKTFLCTIDNCQESFISDGFLMRHITDTHELPIKSFTCEFCSKDFGTKMKLSSHILWNHKDRYIICDICNLSFMGLYNLKTHMKVMHSGTPNFFCEVCARGFNRPRALRNHQKIVHEERLFACTICPKKYATQRNLSIHMKTHLKQKDYQCEYYDCDKSYYNVNRLKRHIALVHQNLKVECLVDGCTYENGRYDYMKLHVEKKHKDLPKQAFDEIMERLKSQNLVH